MRWFTKRTTQQQYIDSVIKVASNLYLNTLSGKGGINTSFQFDLPDSRFRYLIFSLSTVITAVLAYDEKINVQAAELIKGGVQFAKWAGTKYPHDYFTEEKDIQDFIANTENIFDKYLHLWSNWPLLERERKNNEVIDLVCNMIRSTESEQLISKGDINRLGQLSLEIVCRLPTMRFAVEKLTNE